MGWPRLPSGRFVGPQPVDPYACWAEATGGAYLASGTTDRCRVALRLREDCTVDHLRSIEGVTIPAAYAYPMRTCTADVTAGNETWQALHDKALVLLAEPGMAGAKPTQPEWQAIGRATTRVDPPSAGPEVVIGVVDGACGFAHRQFRQRDGKSANGPWKTRLLAYWDQQQGPATLPGWQSPADFGYGRELKLRGENSLESLFAAHLPPASKNQDDDDAEQAFAERTIYGQLGVSEPRVSDWTHGTHVLDTAGGRMPPADAPDEVVDITVRPLPRADVDAAGLVFVQLPECALRDTSGRWAAALVLDGLRYIVARAPAASRIVINLSLGSFAGPHDGSSMLEQALDDLVEEFMDEGLRERLSIVVAAGNAGQARNDGDGAERQCHARAELAAAGQPRAEATLALDLDLPDATETFVELWLAAADPEAPAVPPVSVDLRAPGAAPAITVSPGRVANMADASGAKVIAQVVNQSGFTEAGPRGQWPMVLVAIGATGGNAAALAATGSWQITVHNTGDQALVVEAWVERRDVPGELSGERPQYGFAPGDGVQLSNTNTLGSLANGSGTVVVGGAEFEVEKEATVGAAPKASPSSSRPPDGRHTSRSLRGGGPCVSAPCEFAAAGFYTGSAKTLKGTSMSAAWTTRHIAARSLRDPTRLTHAALCEWLRAGAPLDDDLVPKGGPTATGNFLLPPL